MGISDPFSTTYEGSRQALGTLGTGFSQAITAAGDVQKKKNTLNILKQMGILKEEEQPLTVKDYEEHAKKLGGSIRLDPTLPETEQLSKAEQLAQSIGLPPIPRKTKTIFDAGVAAKSGLEWNPSTGDLVMKPTQKTALNIADLSNLTPQQQIQARALARKIGGVRGTEQLVPSIAQELALGKSIDKIEDELKYSGQSESFKPIRSAAQQIMIGKSGTDKQSTFDDLDDLAEDPQAQKEYLKRMAIRSASTEMQGNVIGKERTIKLLDEIQNDLNNLEAMGVDTNIFTGTAEQVAARAGTVINPEARTIATKTAAAIQNYRRSMTGVQFGMPENQEYKVMFPSISRTANFNTANINALKEVMAGDLENFYGLAMGEENYNKLFKGQPQSSQLGSSTSEANLPESELRRRVLGAADMGTQVGQAAGVIPRQDVPLQPQQSGYDFSKMSTEQLNARLAQIKSGGK